MKIPNFKFQIPNKFKNFNNQNSKKFENWKPARPAGGLKIGNCPPLGGAGFTLIELLVAISIIGILSALLMTNLQDARSRARDVQRKSDLRQLKTALRMYYNDNQGYPVTGTNGIIATFNWGSAFDATGKYMKVLPQDPLTSATNPDYYYEQTASGEGFNLWACLENKSDSSGVTCASGDGSWNTSCTTICFKVSED